MIQAITAGLILGAFSSLHCVGMCGPLALALPVQHLAVWQQRFSALMYNIGRIVTYSVLGLLFGMAGRTIYMAGFQQWLSIISGAVILLFIINYYLLQNAWQPKWAQQLQVFVQHKMTRLLHAEKKGSFLFIGMVNALLPCGMVYVALASALNFSELSLSTGFMAAFGAGTLPLMMVLSIAGSAITLPVRRKIRKAVPYLMTVMAFILILRGLNLGIPFISPVLANAPEDVINCH
jgi:hypothetical protein